jgi:membrane protease YdiL (CAAX protease family)
LTVLLLPAALIWLWRFVNPELRADQLTAVDLVLVQGIMNVVLVAFIAFLVKVVHRRSFRETIHWYRNYDFTKGFLIGLGAILAVSVLIVSSLLPPSSPPPIEKLLSSSSAMWIFAIFGIGVAPMFEEVIFRGFLFKVFTELREAKLVALVTAVLFGGFLYMVLSQLGWPRLAVIVAPILLSGIFLLVLSQMRGSQLAVPVTAVLFALLHVPQLWGSWAGVALIFVVGYILSLVRDRSNSLIPSLIMHTSYNAMLFGVFVISTLVQKGTK